MNNVGIFIISGFFYLFMITFTIIAIYMIINAFIKNKRKKRAYYLLTEKYEVICADKDGIPTFMKKGENIEKI